LTHRESPKKKKGSKKGRGSLKSYEELREEAGRRREKSERGSLHRTERRDAITSAGKGTQLREQTAMGRSRPAYRLVRRPRDNRKDTARGSHPGRCCRGEREGGVLKKKAQRNSKILPSPILSQKKRRRFEGAQHWDRPESKYSVLFSQGQWGEIRRLRREGPADPFEEF